MTLLAVFQTLLYRYTGQDDILVGSPMAGRNRSETEALIGFFVNTPLLRTEFSGNPTFRQLLRRVREITLGAHAHQDIPIEDLLEELRVQRDLSRPSLFQVMFNMHNFGDDRLKLPGLIVELLTPPRHESKFDLMLVMTEIEEGLKGTLVYNSDLFNADTVARMLQHFRTLLEGVVVDPCQRVSGIQLLTNNERQQLLVDWNRTERDVLRGRCIHQLFEVRAEQTPDAIAVVFEQEQLTYGELNRRANQLARHLRKRGAGPEVLVAICMERSVETIVGLLGILKAGGGYVPLDPNYPMDRLAFMLEETQSPLLLTDRQQLKDLPKHSAETICLDWDWGIISQEGEENLISQATEENLAYVIYTSGSTGRSKGVMISHHSLVNAYLAWEEAYQLRPTSAHLQMANFAFDVFTGDLVRALCSGGKLVMCPWEWLLAPQHLYTLMCQEKVECAEFVPAVLRPLVQYLEESDQRLDFMQVLICGSDSWYAGEYKKLLHLCGLQTRLINSFGLTEATIDSSYFESATLDLPSDQLLPIGRPIANTQLYILDVNLQPAPIGVPGELHIGGAGLARGYYRRPDLTAEKFIPNPFSDEAGESLYKTGDLARYLPDGNIEFLGRLDRQVKIRGFRIELEEIEAVLCGHPGVRQAVVLAREDVPREKRLVAYLVAGGKSAPSIHELHSFLKRRLPDYMVPSAFVVLDRLPLTPNGKVDRRALPVPDHTRPELAKTFVAPRTPVEQAVAEIWGDILRLEHVGVDDNFFELGGHSLLATQVISRLRSACQVEVTLRKLFETPTVAGLAVAIAQIQAYTAEQGEMARLLGELEGLSDEEAERLLAMEMRSEDEDFGYPPRNGH
jgi:amino acid adenylation domain-containing protein